MTENPGIPHEVATVRWPHWGRVCPSGRSGDVQNLVDAALSALLSYSRRPGGTCGRGGRRRWGSVDLELGVLCAPDRCDPAAGEFIVGPRTSLILIILAICIVMPVWAELENVVVGGEIRIRGNYIVNWAVSDAPIAVRFGPGSVVGRAIGEFFSGAPAFNGLGVVSPYSWDDDMHKLKFLEQRTRLNALATFTNDVNAFIELDEYSWWGEDFRSDYLTGTDFRSVTDTDVEIYQSYIEANNVWSYPLRLRIGRQELSFGSEWLVGPKDFGPFFSGRSFDAVRVTYGGDSYTVDAWWSKLAETSPLEEDGDVDFYGVYASCTAIENMTFDAYWLWLRDGRELNDTNLGWLGEEVESWFGIDNYDVTSLHTIGLRAAGLWNGFDFDIEAAYQFGDAARPGFFFKPFVYGDDNADYSAWAVTAQVGYTLDMAWQPRPFLRYAFYDGEDNRDISFWDWLNPFDAPEASVSFNRLFSNHMYNGFFDLQNDLSNVHVFMGGVVAHPTEALDLIVDLGYYMVDETFDAPVYFKVGKNRIAFAPFFPWWTEEADDDLGWVSDILGVYHYSEDLSFSLHWSHLFTGDGVSDGNYAARNGLMYTGGSDDDDGDFVTFETRIRF